MWPCLNVRANVRIHGDIPMDICQPVRRLLLIAPLLLVLTACGDDDDVLSNTNTPTTEATTPAATFSSTPSPTQFLLDGTMLVFIRDPVDQLRGYGALWISDADGHNARQISPDGINAAIASTGRDEGGGSVIYYVTQDTETTQTIWLYDLDSRSETSIFSYEGDPDTLSASVSPDGQYIAYVASSGLYFHDRTSDETRLLFASGDYDACQAAQLAECHAYIAPQWSTDNSLILATHSVYEGGWVDVIDPFADPPITYIEDSRTIPSSGNWSPDSDAVCAQGIYGGASSLYLFEAPTWETERLTPEYEDWTQNPEGRWVTDCGWLSETEILFATSLQNPPLKSELDLIDTSSRETTVITTFETSSCCSGVVTALPDARAAMLQFIDSAGYTWVQPLLVDIDTGASQPILSPGDFVVAAFTR